MTLLEQVSSSGDIKKLTSEQRKKLCREIREFLVRSVSKTGGHLASNLGVVELTVALHTVFDIPGDKFVWDVGHQSYVNKLLTGRMADFENLRKLGGISGFPKRAESPADVFDTGHSSTSISAALGLARARDLERDGYCVGAIFGDGALTGGMMYEAMNDAGRYKKPLILILNDNNMSISKNVGSISKYLRALRIKPGYSTLKRRATLFLGKIPIIGNPLYNLMSGLKKRIQRVILRPTIFENFGFEYFGPVDGHDTESLINVLSLAKSKQKPVFIHIRTKKGKGYAPAEHRPDTFHGIGPFCAETGKTETAERDYSAAFGGALFDVAAENDKVVGITAAMPVSTGMEIFSKYFKDRFFDVGIAEQHGVTMAAGFAAGGYIPVFPVYSSFLQRAYDQILHDVCLQKLHVVFGVDRAGVVGADGETHQGIYDIAFMNSMPHMTVLSPSNYEQLEQMLSYAVNDVTGPVAIRYPRGSEQFEGGSFTPHKANVIADGDEITVYATGRMMNTAAEVRNILGDGVRIVEITTIKPLDTQTVLETALPITCVIEDGVAKGGLGEVIGALFAENGINTKFRIFAYPDEPVVQGSVCELDKKYGVDSKTVADILSEMKG